MNWEKVTSHSDFLGKRSPTGRTFLLLHKQGSLQSECALNHIHNAPASDPGLKFFTADVNEVKDIHSEYGITTVPALLVFTGGKLTNVIKGCQDRDFYTALANNSIHRSDSSLKESDVKRVTVYSTPTCSWCNTLKSWLQKNNIRYTDIDVSRDQRAAEELVKRTGQQGVPQTDINGQVVVGFNQQRLKELLGI